jgi:hypothetical protein
MQSAKLIPAASRFEALLLGLLGLLDDPHAAIAIALMMAASAISTLRPSTLIIDPGCSARDVTPT